MSSDDINFLREQMRKVRPAVASNKVRLNKRQAKAHEAYQQRQLAAQTPPSSDSTSPQLSGDSHLSWRAAGFDQHQFARLAAGHDIPASAQLDLHGCRLDQANALVASFIARCCRAGHHRALIVHGKGLHSADGVPVLKIELAAWLRANAKVLGYCSANPADGGTGALYVQLSQ